MAREVMPTRQATIKLTSGTAFRPPKKLLIPAAESSLLVELDVVGGVLVVLNTADTYTPVRHMTSSITTIASPDCGLVQQYSHCPASLTGRCEPIFCE